MATAKTVKAPTTTKPKTATVVNKPAVKKTTKTVKKTASATSKKPKKTMVKKTIGAAGGVLVHGKFKVRIPRNSLHQAHEFKMEILGNAMNLTPNNVHFTRRVMVELPCDKPEGMNIICYNDQDGFKPVPIETNYDEDSKVLYGYVTKLDDYRVGKV